MPLQATSGAASYDAFGGGVPVAINYIEDVFSTWIYTGNGSTQTITNGIDLSTKGGLVWIKGRSEATNNFLFDTSRSALNEINSNTTDAEASLANSLTAFNTTGFSIGSAAGINTSPESYASWTFRKQPKFFDIVTYTGDGTSQRPISHSLGSTPGCIIVKQTNAVRAWPVFHKNLTSAGEVGNLILNTTAAQVSSSYFPTVSDTIFQVSSSSDVNESGGTYVAYLFAHDAGGFGLTGTDNVVSCGTFTTNSSAFATINLGYEPQWVMVKKTSTTSNWIIEDLIRGMPEGNTRGQDRALYANSAVQEDLGNNLVAPTSTGFTFSQSNTSTYIYVAIRRGLMKAPIDATKVFQPVAYTGTNVDNRLVNTGILTDMTMARIRSATSNGGFYTADRLRANYFLGTAVQSAEALDADSFMAPTTLSTGGGDAFSAMNGFGVGNDVTRQLNQSSTTQLAYAFRRAASFFDEVCYTGTGANRTVAHNLTVVPELMIFKKRSSGNLFNWSVYISSEGNTKYLSLNTTDQVGTDSNFWNDTTPTSSVFTLGIGSEVNESAGTYVAYLFATCSGVSKVGSYTGNGTTQTIDCGFGAGGARFVLIKRTDSTGDWYTYDTARGMTVLTDPYLLPNTTAAESATLGSVTTVATGFALNSTILAAINVNAGTYIFLAIA